MSHQKHHKTRQHKAFLRQERINRCAIHAAEFIKYRGGDRIAQDTAADYAGRLAHTQISAACAIYRGFKAGMAVIQNQKGHRQNIKPMEQHI